MAEGGEQPLPNEDPAEDVDSEADEGDGAHGLPNEPAPNGVPAAAVPAEAPAPAVRMGIHQVANLGASEVAVQIRDLKRQRDDIKRTAKRASAALRNASKREQRLRTKAEKLDNNDLLEVFRMRQEADVKRTAAKAKAKANVAP
jgi:hypothetical protein